MATQAASVVAGAGLEVEPDQEQVLPKTRTNQAQSIVATPAG